MKENFMTDAVQGTGSFLQTVNSSLADFFFSKDRNVVNQTIEGVVTPAYNYSVLKPIQAYQDGVAQIKDWRLSRVVLHKLEDNTSAMYKTVDGTTVPIDNLSGLDSFIAIIKTALFSYQDQITNCYPTGETIMLPHWLAVKYVSEIDIINSQFAALHHTESLIKATYPILFILIVVVYLFSAFRALFALVSDTALTSLEALLGKITGQQNYRVTKFRSLSTSLQEQTKQLVTLSALDRPDGKTTRFINFVNLLYQMRSRIPRIMIGVLFSRIASLTTTHIRIKASIVTNYEKMNRDILAYYDKAIITPQNQASSQYVEDLIINTCGNLKGYLWLLYDKGPVDKIILIGVVSFTLGFVAAKAAAFIAFAASRLGTIGVELIDQKLHRLNETITSQNLSNFDSDAVHDNNRSINNTTNLTNNNPNNGNDTNLTNNDPNNPNNPNNGGENAEANIPEVVAPALPMPPITQTMEQSLNNLVNRATTAVRAPRIEERDIPAIEAEAERLALVQQRGIEAEYEPALSQTGGRDLARAEAVTNLETNRVILDALHQAPGFRTIFGLPQLLNHQRILERRRHLETTETINVHAQKIITRSRAENRERDAIRDQIALTNQNATNRNINNEDTFSGILGHPIDGF